MGTHNGPCTTKEYKLVVCMCVRCQVSSASTRHPLSHRRFDVTTVSANTTFYYIVQHLKWKTL